MESQSPYLAAIWMWHLGIWVGGTRGTIGLDDLRGYSNLNNSMILKNLRRLDPPLLKSETERKMSKFQVVLRDTPFNQHLIPLNIKPSLLSSELLDAHLWLDPLILLSSLPTRDIL